MPAGAKPKPVHVKVLFDQLDLDKDGVLSFDEAKAGLQGKVPTPQHRAVFDKYDADGNGMLDLAEFTQLCKALDGAALSFAGGSRGRSSSSVIDEAWSSQQQGQRMRNFLMLSAAYLVVSYLASRPRR